MKFLLGLLVTGKLGKVLLTSGTMLLSIFTYTFVFGWKYAVGLVLLLFVHEMGHYLAAKQRGLDVGAPTFIPFVGAWIELKDQPHDVETEAYIGLAGPFIGTLGAMACYFVYRQTGDKMMLALASAGIFLNLFNLIPLSPFDGGRITAIISPRVWLLGVPILVLLFFYRPSPILVLMAVMATPQVISAWKYDPKAPENALYYSVSLEQKLSYGAFYLGLVAFLAIMSNDLHLMMK
jgi:Zn-dependent protease